MEKKISNENRLIFLCAGIKIDNSKQQDIRKTLSNPINWNQIIETARYHQILPFIYYNLNKAGGINIIPADIAAALENCYYRNLSRNVGLWEELSRISNAANRAEFTFIVLKGFSLIETIYNSNHALRPMTDIDILVKENDLMKAKSILLQSGYQEDSNGPFSAAYIQKYQTVFNFIKPNLPDSSFSIELHRTVARARPHKIFLPQLWERIQKKYINGQKITILSFEDMLLSLALHLRGHLNKPLLMKSIIDIAELLNSRGHTLDWEYIRIMSKNNHMVNTIYFVLYISEELLGISIPADKLRMFQPFIIKKKLIYLWLNKYNFLNAKKRQGFIIRFLIFDSAIDFLVYLWRTCFVEKFIAKKIICPIKKIVVNTKKINE